MAMLYDPSVDTAAEDSMDRPLFWHGTNVNVEWGQTPPVTSWLPGIDPAAHTGVKALSATSVKSEKDFVGDFPRHL